MTFDDDKVSVIGVGCVEEHEDGSATYSYHMDDHTKDKMVGLGIELIITCADYEIDISDALKYLTTYHDGGDTEV